MRKNQKGITLIALVVTIIVLLILAGVSIAMITGQSGILGQARTSAWKTKLGEAQSDVSLKVSEYWTDFMGNTYGGATASYKNTGSNNGWTVETDVTLSALKAVKTELGNEFKIYYTEQSTSTGVQDILITYNDTYWTEAKVQSGGNRPAWGPLNEGSAPVSTYTEVK